MAEGGEGFLGVAEPGGHYIFKRNVEAFSGAGKCKGAASGARAYDRDTFVAVRVHVIWRWS